MNSALLDAGDEAPGLGVANVQEFNILVGKQRVDLAALRADLGSDTMQEAPDTIKFLKIHRYTAKPFGKRITGISLALR